ncbi:MAG: sporulation protein YqfD [Christensenellaceae bacterium]|jgi:similar to stage IV sporulation protein|nr:sporulation protein YqfD [Christensenellaceae bacterium]
MSKQLHVRFDLQDGDIKTLNRLCKFGLYDVEVFDDNSMRFCVPLMHKSDVKRVLGKRTYTIRERNNVLTLLNFFYSRVSLVVTAIVCIISFIVFDQFVFRVSLQGLAGDEYSQVKAYLDTHGVKTLTPKRTVRNPNLAHDIVAQFPFVASSSIYVQGSKVIVSVHRADNMVPQIPLVDIVSTHDGVIGDIVVFSGVAAVTVGDVVRKGDLLVTGTRPTAIITIVNGGEVVAVIDNTMIK